MALRSINVACVDAGREAAGLQMILGSRLGPLLCFWRSRSLEPSALHGGVYKGISPKWWKMIAVSVGVSSAIHAFQILFYFFFLIYILGKRRVGVILFGVQGLFLAPVSGVIFGDAWGNLHKKQGSQFLYYVSCHNLTEYSTSVHCTRSKQSQKNQRFHHKVKQKLSKVTTYIIHLFYFIFVCFWAIHDHAQGLLLVALEALYRVPGIKYWLGVSKAGTFPAVCTSLWP